MNKRELWTKMFAENDVALACAIHLCERYCGSIEELKKNEDFITKKIQELDEPLSEQSFFVFSGEKEPEEEDAAFRLTCPSCGFQYTGRVFSDEVKGKESFAELKWHGECPKCHNDFPVEVPHGKIIMAFTDPLDTLDVDTVEHGESIYKYFKDDFTGQGVHTIYAFDDPYEFVEKWKAILYKPRGMWYWVLDGMMCICSGACDPYDIEIFREHWHIKD